MSKYERTIIGDFNEILSFCETSILKKSVSASLTDETNFESNGIRVAIRVFERYSLFGKDLVSLCVSLIGESDKLILTAISSGAWTDSFLEKFMETFEIQYPNQ